MQSDIRSLLTISKENATAISGLQEVAKAHQDRLAKLEASPEGIRGWLTLVLAGIAILVSLTCSGVGMLVTLWPHLH